MIKKCFLGLGIILGVLPVYALDVVYPKQKTVTINSPATFFVGSSDYSTPLIINSVEVPVHSSGGFAKAVPLQVGENNFILKSGNEVLEYKIIRPTPSKNVSVANAELKIYEEPLFVKVAEDNLPLRSTPEDAGINRLAHLQSGIPLIADGEKGNFYRVKLGRAKYGWILKSHVVADDLRAAQRENFLTGATVDSDEDFVIYTFRLTERMPWSIVEGKDTLNITVYNVLNQANNDTYTVKVPLKHILEGKDLIGYSAEYKGTNFIVKIRKPLSINETRPLKNVKIAIDAGHGGSESGAIGCLGDYEKDINLKYAKELSRTLKNRGADVIMIRNRDEYLSLKARVDKANDENAVIFISIHGNALPDILDPIKVNGTEIYYYYNQAKPLATAIMSSLVTNAEVKNHGIIQQSFAVVRNTNALSILIELGYLINPEDNAKLLNEDFRKKSVEAISDGLENYLRGQI